MNDTKWREVFRILIDQGIKECTWHFLNDPGEYKWPLPLLSDIRRDGIADGRWCPVYFRDIERVVVPRAYEVARGKGLVPWRRENDLPRLMAVLGSLGQLDTDEETDRLIIHGHRRHEKSMQRKPLRDAGGP